MEEQIDVLFSSDLEHKLSVLKDVLSGVIENEEDSKNTLHLTANENKLSRLSTSFMLSDLSQRYHLGTFEEHGVNKVITRGDFIFRGLPQLYKLEYLASKAAENMFHSKLVDFRPLSGLHATLSLLSTVSTPSDVIYSLPPIAGGHASTQKLINRIGRKSHFISWDMKNCTVDLDEFKKNIKQYPGKIILLDCGDPLYKLPVAEIRLIVGNEVLILYDASHTYGLIAGNQFQSPLCEGSDILFGNTHKTFPGPQKGMINFKNKDFGYMISEKIGSSMLSSQHTHHAIALYITILEMQAFGESYAKQVIANAKYLAKALVEYGLAVFNIKGNYTDSHMLLLDCGSMHDCDFFCKELHNCNISTNTRYVYGKKYIRIGVQEVTRLGMKEEEMRLIARFIFLIIRKKQPLLEIQHQVVNLKSKFKKICFSFDQNFEL